MDNIIFHVEDVKFDLTQGEKLSSWLNLVAEQENNSIQLVNYIFCSDPYLHQINLQYLQHDEYTDIISFHYQEDPVEGDIFISIDRIRDNAEHFQVSFDHELCRVLVHGMLHLLGYLDKTPADKQLMTQKEDHYLDLLDH